MTARPPVAFVTGARRGIGRGIAYALADAGFDLLSIANNHANDFGERGRKNTVKRLAEASIHYAGLIEHPHTVFTRDGVIYGFCAFAPDKAAVNLNNYKPCAQSLPGWLQSQIL